LAVLALLAPLSTGAQEAPAVEPEKAWSFSASLYAYDVPDSDDYFNPGFTADHGRLHLEARSNYEAIDTGSIWAGANFSVGESWAFEATVMMGGVFGELEGVAPGYRILLTHAWFELSSEAEYFIDNHGHEGNYFYTWTEVAGYPTDWFRAGLAIQRTRAYASDLDIQRGAFVGFSFSRWDIAAYDFNPFDEATYVLAGRVTF
jgi:hypothetical protein